MELSPRAWLIGSQADCDVVVAEPTVSGRHCRLVRDRRGYTIQDLGSTNGTFVNGRRLPPEQETRISQSDVITLGQTVRMPWPASENGPGVAAVSPACEDLKVFGFRGSAMVLGRDPECDFAIDAPAVSGRHARLVRKGDRYEIEDLQSTNGTYVNGSRVLERAAIAPGDRIMLGSTGPYTFRPETPAQPARSAPEQELVGVLVPIAEPAPRPAPGALRPAPALQPSAPAVAPRAQESWADQFSRLVREGLGASLPAGRLWGLRAAALGLPLVEGLVVLVWTFLLPRSPTMSWATVASRFGTEVGYALVLLPLLTGLVSVLPELLIERSEYLRALDAGLNASAYFAAKLAVFLPLALLQMALFEAIAYPLLGLKASPLVVFIVLGLTALIGLCVALWIAAWRGSLVAPAIVVSVIFAIMLGAIPAMHDTEPLRSAARLGTSLTPVRWAFEALLVLEADRRPTWIPKVATETGAGGTPDGAASPAPIDMAEPAFHTDSERMGPIAAIFMLAAMLLTLLGWGYAILFVPWGGTGEKIGIVDC
jgi:pSer/pThr/pTyr-binding forkhead associated (FHA) protein